MGLLRTLLLDAVDGFTDQDWELLESDEVKKRLLVSELYQALTTDPDIMPLLVEVILQRRDVPDLFTALSDRIGEDYKRIP